MDDISLPKEDMIETTIAQIYKIQMEVLSEYILMDGQRDHPLNRFPNWRKNVCNDFCCILKGAFMQVVVINEFFLDHLDSGSSW